MRKLNPSARELAKSIPWRAYVMYRQDFRQVYRVGRKVAEALREERERRKRVNYHQGEG